MTTQKTNLFVYGTLKRGHRLNSVLGGGSELIYSARTILNDFDLFNYQNAFPIMMLTTQGEGYKILGELYSVTTSVMERVNSIESASGYIPFSIDVTGVEETDKPTQAIAFIYPAKSIGVSNIKPTTHVGINGEVKVWT